MPATCLSLDLGAAANRELVAQLCRLALEAPALVDQGRQRALGQLGSGATLSAPRPPLQQPLLVADAP